MKVKVGKTLDLGGWRIQPGTELEIGPVVSEPRRMVTAEIARAMFDKGQIEGAPVEPAPDFARIPGFGVETTWGGDFGDPLWEHGVQETALETGKGGVNWDAVAGKEFATPPAEDATTTTPSAEDATTTTPSAAKPGRKSR